jgi:hypothetical protein
MTEFNPEELIGLKQNWDRAGLSKWEGKKA